MGQGQALREKFYWHKGQVLNPSFLGYLSPISFDTAKIETYHLDTIDPLGPYGAKEVGESNIVGVLAAIGNAIYNVIGIRVKELPFEQEKFIIL